MPPIAEILIALVGLGAAYAAILWIITKSKTDLVHNQRLITALKAAAAIAIGSAGSYAAFKSPATDHHQPTNHLRSP